MLISVKSLADIEAIEKDNAHTRALIDALAIHYHYRPLPQRIRDGILPSSYGKIR